MKTAFSATFYFHLLRREVPPFSAEKFTFNFLRKSCPWRPGNVSKAGVFETFTKPHTRVRSVYLCVTVTKTVSGLTTQKRQPAMFSTLQCQAESWGWFSLCLSLVPTSKLTVAFTARRSANNTCSTKIISFAAQ